MHYSLSCANQHTLGLTPVSQQGWHFDLLSAMFGAAATLLLLLLAYAYRGRLRRIWEAIADSLTKLRHRLQAGIEGRYRELVAAWARSLITPPRVASLDALFVEPELLAPPAIPESVTEIEQASVKSRVLPLHRILGGHPQLIILGTPGAGRTTALAHLALTCATATQEESSAGPGEVPESVRERLPLCVLLPAVDWDEDDGEKPKGNGMDKLLKSAVATVGGSRGMTNLLRQILETGRAVVLVDGWNELGSQQQHLATTWLADLVNSLPGNTWVVNVGMRNYAPLTEAGFIPLSLAPWDARRVQEFAERWAEAWTTPDESPSISPHDLAIELRRAARAGASSLELALRAFVTLSDGQSPDGSAALFNRTLDLLLWQEQEQEEKPWLSAACRSALGQVALDLQQGERTMASREEVETAIEAALPPAEERTSRATARALRALTGERGLLRPTGSTSYTFTHPVWQAYLAARRLAAVDPSNLVEHLENPRWSDVLRFYAEIGDMGPLVAAWLRTPDDMFYMRLCTLSSWIRAAPEGSAWRDGAMALLARTFLQATPFARTRRTLAKSLAATGVPGVAHLFKQALQHPDAEFRAAAVLGLADVAGEADLSAFEPPLNDDDPTVRETAVRALASLDFDVAKQRLERVLQEEDDALRPVVAEVLAKHSEERVDILREMAQSEDVVTRRAAVSGLAKAGAHELLEEMMQEDEQWIVRTAASAALEEMQRREEPSGVEPTPEVEHLPWLNSWAAAQGEGVGLGEAAQQMLRRALQEGDDPVRLVAAQMLAQIGRSDDVELLRTMLADPNPAVADAALEALAEIGRRYDLRIEQQGR